MSKIKPSERNEEKDSGRVKRAVKNSAKGQYISGKKEDKEVNETMPLYESNKSKKLIEPGSIDSDRIYFRIILENRAEGPESKMTSLEKLKLASNGISKKDLEQLKKKASFNYDQLTEVLSVSRAALINKKGNARFNRDLSEKIIAIAAIYSYGFEVFEDKDRFNNWIFRPNQALGGKAPYELLSSSFGREEVKDLIGRIDYGVYS